MPNTYPITPEQKAILDRFTCERLTARPKNLYEIQDFYSRRGEGLVNSLLSRGWSSDLRGHIAYYLIRNPEGEIVMFFSLKCGVLFDPDYAAKYLEQFKETLEKDDALARWYRAIDGDPVERHYFERQRRRMGPDKYEDFVETLLIKSDKKQEPNPKIIRVSTSRPAIELVEFCANDQHKDCWDRYGFPSHRKMGETLFWHFIVPKMLEINTLIGCEFVYLFAADSTPNRTLTNYYREKLHFNTMTQLGTIKPAYDLNCFFMGNRLRSIAGLSNFPRSRRRTDDMWGLDRYMMDYFEHFNLDLSADDIV